MKRLLVAVATVPLVVAGCTQPNERTTLSSDGFTTTVTDIADGFFSEHSSSAVKMVDKTQTANGDVLSDSQFVFNPDGTVLGQSTAVTLDGNTETVEIVCVAESECYERAAGDADWASRDVLTRPTGEDVLDIGRMVSTATPPVGDVEYVSARNAVEMRYGSSDADVSFQVARVIDGDLDALAVVNEITVGGEVDNASLVFTPLDSQPLPSGAPR